MIFINIYFVPDRKKMKIKVKFLTDRQANRQTDRQVDRQTDRQTDRQIGRRETEYGLKTKINDNIYL